MEPIARLDPNSKEYGHDYTRGWNASKRGADGALDRADARNESHAWYDGYHDHAAGREKWHIRTCKDTHCRTQHMSY